MKWKIILSITLILLFLTGCEYDATTFSKMKTIINAKVVNVDTERVGKVSYTELRFIKDGKKHTMRFESEDYGFKEYYEASKLFKNSLYVNLIILDRKGDKNDTIVAASLSKGE